MTTDVIRFGHECCRGGVLIDMLVGVSCRSLGGQALEGIADQLAAADCRQAIQQLEQMNAKAESPEAVARQERIWGRRTFGLLLENGHARAERLGNDNATTGTTGQQDWGAHAARVSFSAARRKPPTQHETMKRRARITPQPNQVDHG